MMKQLRLVFMPVMLVSLLLLGNGCVKRVPQSNYQKAIEGWRQRHIVELVAVWGPATRSFWAPNGNKVFVYERSGTQSELGTVSPGYYDLVKDRKRMVGYCSTYFETNKMGIIIKTTYAGKACEQDRNKKAQP
jgi:hypothetical protein